MKIKMIARINVTHDGGQREVELTGIENLFDHSTGAPVAVTRGWSLADHWSWFAPAELLPLDEEGEAFLAALKAARALHFGE